MNIPAVEHHGAGLRLGMDEVEVVLTLETRDPDYRGEVVDDLEASGYRVELVR